MLPLAASVLTFRRHALTLCCSVQAGLSREATGEAESPAQWELQLCSMSL